MSKVASITISAKSRPTSVSNDNSPTATHVPTNGADEEFYQNTDRHSRNAGITSSDSEEDKHIRRRGSSSSSSPERRRLSSQRNYDTYDKERGLIHAGRSGKMSSRQRTLERELNTEDPTFVASSDDALASSDDGLEDNFIPRNQPDQYTMVKENNGSDRDEGASIYEKKNIEPPRAKLQPAGRRVKSATGKLLDNYERDQSFDNLSEGEREIEKPKTSVSILKAAYANKAVESKPAERYKVDEELEHIRCTMQARGMMQDNDSDDGGKHDEADREVLYRKSLSSIKDRFFAAASGQKVRSSSDSEDDMDEDNKKEEVVGPPQKVTDMKNQWQSRGSWQDRNKGNEEKVLAPSHRVFDMRNKWQQPKSWQKQENLEEIVLPEESVTEIRQNWPQIRSFDGDDEDKENWEEIVVPSKPVLEMKDKWQKGHSWIDDGKIDAREEIDTSQVGSARNAFKEMENRRDANSTVNRPRVSKIADPKQVMEARRQKTYGDDFEVDGVIKHEGQDELATVDFDVDQIKAAKHTFKKMEVSADNEDRSLRKPSMKLVKQEDVRKTMDDHRRKVSAEDFDDYAEHIKPNGTAHYLNGESEAQQEA